MSKWAQYQGFSELSKKFGGPNNLIFTIIASSVAVATAVAVPITAAITKSLCEKRDERKEVLKSLKKYDNGKISIKEGDTLTVGYLDDDVALIKVNDVDEPYYIPTEELKKITRKGEKNV